MNSRLPISGNLPVEVALAMFDAAELSHVEPTDEDLDFAKAELIMEVEHGKTIGGMDLEACLDCELNQTETGQTFIRELAQALSSPYGSDECAAGYRIRVAEFLDRIVAKHIPESAVQERAEYNMEES